MKNMKAILNALTEDETKLLLEETLEFLPDEDVLEIVMIWARDHKMVDELFSRCCPDE